MKLPVTLIAPKPQPGDPGSFGAVRKHDIHTGIDLYTNEGEPVYNLYPGTVVAIEKFTGAHADSPWWEDTFAVLVESDLGVILYGEITPEFGVMVGDTVMEDALLGHVKRVLKEDKGKNSTSMLHLEYYTKGTRKSVWWKLGEYRPLNLLNPYKALNPIWYYRYLNISKFSMTDYENNPIDYIDIPIVHPKVSAKLSAIQEKIESSTSENYEELMTQLKSIVNYIKHTLGDEWTVKTSF